jgi:hypothetical protein
MDGTNQANREKSVKTNDQLLEEYLSNGGEITVVPAKKVVPHSHITKSHRFGGKYTRYNMGGKYRAMGRRTS